MCYEVSCVYFNCGKVVVISKENKVFFFYYYHILFLSVIQTNNQPTQFISIEEDLEQFLKEHLC